MRVPSRSSCGCLCRLCGVVVGLVAGCGLLSGAALGSGQGGPPVRGEHLKVTFEGKGGGRYVDTFRLINQEEDNECYARKVVDETVTVNWSASWSAVSLAQPPRRLVSSASDAQGGVTGGDVRDGCDEPDEADPLWVGSDLCDGVLPVIQHGRLSLEPRKSGRVLVSLTAPVFGSPAEPCELDIRNDQLVAHALINVSRLQPGGTVSVAVGTDHPGPGDAYQPTFVCKAIPHRYDGEIWSYDCRDTLTWSGTLTISRPA